MQPPGGKALQLASYVRVVTAAPPLCHQRGIYWRYGLENIDVMETELKHCIFYFFGLNEAFR